MAKLAVFTKAKTKPGKRDEVRRLWEQQLKPRAEHNPAQEVYFCCYDDSDPDLLYLFVLYSERAHFESAVESPWLARYIAEVTPLLAGQPEIALTTPIWAKGESL